VLSSPEKRQQYDLALLDHLDVEVSRRIWPARHCSRAAGDTTGDAEMPSPRAPQDYLSRYTEFLLTPNGLGMSCSRLLVQFSEQQLMIAT
jgi:hypothetical protein